MSAKRNCLMTLLLIVSGLVGGAASNRVFLATPARAGQMDAVPEVRSRAAPERGQAIRIRKLELVDKKGKTRASLGVNPDGATSIVFYDDKGSASLALGLSKTGSPRLMLQGPGGRKVTLDISSKGTSALRLWGKTGKVRAVLQLAPEGNPGLTLRDKTGKPRGIFRLWADGNPTLGFDDERGKTRAVFGAIPAEAATDTVPERPIPSLILLDKNEKITWQAP